MIPDSTVLRPVQKQPTVWGLTPVQLHDRYWAARGVCVVRPDEHAPLPFDAELFMLTDQHTLAVFPLRRAVELIYWVKPVVTFVRIRGRRRTDYAEMVRDDGAGHFVRFERHYGSPSAGTARIALTR